MTLTDAMQWLFPMRLVLLAAMLLLTVCFAVVDRKEDK